ncbi:MAG TPA: hypothetical protein VFD63_20235 [Pyrinomonadaceae bacterium]|jgi:hypothetical protein|nr:hypothetical protein [Pyrinomonadaceae bacterium]
MKFLASVLLLGALVTGIFAQRPRTMEPDTSSKPAPARAPQSVKAKYEGGVFGYNKTMEGTLTFDDNNNRLIFRDKKTPKEISIPYDAIMSAFADTQKRQPKAATVASQVPLIYSLPAHFIKTKVRYLTLQYNDPDSKVSGITSFKLENKEILESVVSTLATKANMALRGDIYVKKKDSDTVK